MSVHQIQKQANILLSQGLFQLRSRPIQSLTAKHPPTPGNYLILTGDVPVYIGEAKALSLRLSQQARPQTSTFYKSHIDIAGETGNDISEFSVQVMATNFGRKEIEDFGISNLPNLLNKFQIGKRKKIDIPPYADDWLHLQAHAMATISETAAYCLEVKPADLQESIGKQSPGLYIIRHEAGNVVYIGESSNVGKRLSTHSSQTYFSAFRRNLANQLGYSLITRNGKKRYLSDDAEANVDRYMRECTFTAIPLHIGRYEVEEYLIAMLNPQINRKARTGSKASLESA